MKALLVTHGKFHSFDMARQLNKAGMLDKIITPYPMSKLQNERLDASLIRSFPYVHGVSYVLGGKAFCPPAAKQALQYMAGLAIDDFASRNLGSCDTLVALSGSGLKSGRRLQQRGGVYVCDRGSTHARFQDQIVSDEYARWGVPYIRMSERGIVREEAEYAQANAIFVPSSFARETFVQLGLPREKLLLTPYGVDLSRFFPDGSPSPDRFEVLFVGTVSVRKGIGYLLEAFKSLKHPAKRLRIVGPIPDETKDILSRLPEGVELLGKQPQDSVKRFMSESHVMVLPSIEEGLALVQAQALACGCPVIATPNTGCEDLLTNGVEGIVVPARDAAGLAEAMTRLADAPGLRAEMSAAAIDRVKSFGGWDAYGDVVIGHLSSLHKQRSAA